MAVPDAIQKQADVAEALQKQLATGTAVELVPDKPQVVNVNPDEYVSAEPGKAPAPVAEVTPQVEQVPAQPQPSDDPWEHKYNVLQGKYNRDLTELRQELDSQAKTIANLNSLIVSLNSRSPEPQAASSDEDEPQAGQSVLDPDKFTGYGAEMLDLVALVQKQAEEIATLKGETNTIAERQVKTDAEKYYDALDLAVKEWRVINKDPQFIAWLQEPEGLSNVPRQSNMTAAHNALDASTVAKYFLAYQANGNQTPNLQPSTPTTPAAPGQPNLLGQVVPADTGVSHEIKQPEGQQVVVVTRAQFNQAVKDRVQNKITEDQFKVISDNFQRSIAAGTVV